MAVLLLSCGVVSQKESTVYRKTMNGNWLLEKVTYEGGHNEFDITIFGKGAPACFEGSSWYFNQNNATGSYTLNGGREGCTSDTQNIIWSIFEPIEGIYSFQFKPVAEGQKAKEVKVGYRMDILDLSETQMRLRSTNRIEGENKSLQIIYHYIRQ